MKLVIHGVLLSLALGSAPAFAAGTSYPLSCIGFDPTQLTTVPESDFYRQIVSNQILVYSADGNWGDLDSGTFDAAKTAADNQQLAEQVTGVIQDYGINSRCVNLSYDGTPAAEAPDYNGFLKDGELPSGTSPHDGNCTRFVAQNLVVNQVYRSGDDLTVEIDEVVDPVSQTLLFSTWDGTGAAFKQFLVDQNAARFCTVSISDPNFYIGSSFVYFTR